jgi:hypothetical protein
MFNPHDALDCTFVFMQLGPMIAILPSLLIYRIAPTAGMFGVYGILFYATSWVFILYHIRKRRNRAL